MDQDSRGKQRRAILAGIAGNVMEWFDFTVYGYFAAIIGRQFFPAEDPISSLLAAFGVFAAGFLMRPFGSLIFGSYRRQDGAQGRADRLGSLDGCADLSDRTSPNLSPDRHRRIGAAGVAAAGSRVIGRRRVHHIRHLSRRAFHARASRVPRELWAVWRVWRRAPGIGDRRPCHLGPRTGFRSELGMARPLCPRHFRGALRALPPSTTRRGSATAAGRSAAGSVAGDRSLFAPRGAASQGWSGSMPPTLSGFTSALSISRRTCARPTTSRCPRPSTSTRFLLWR